MKMTLAEATEIRTRQLQGAEVDPEQAELAMRTIKELAGKPTRGRSPGRKYPKPEPKPHVETNTPAPLVIPEFRSWQPGQQEHTEDPAAVVRALSPWALRKPVDEPESPKHWPRPEGVDIDAVHRRKP
jgi:hypothetical protein